MLVLLERDNFGVNSAISLTSYAVVCSNVVVHNSDHNAVMVAIVDYYRRKMGGSVGVWAVWGTPVVFRVQRGLARRGPVDCVSCLHALIPYPR